MMMPDLTILADGVTLIGQGNSLAGNGNLKLLASHTPQERVFLCHNSVAGTYGPRKRAVPVAVFPSCMFPVARNGNLAPGLNLILESNDMTNLSIISNENFLVTNNTVKTTSMKVAEAFGKRHTHVTEKIRSLDCSSDFRSANFSAHPYINEQNGEKYTLYEMTKDGFMFLVMGFTGKKAARVKEAYINAFNMMMDKLYITGPATLTPAHQRALQEAVANKVGHNRALFPKVWGAVKSHFRVGTYKDLPDTSFDDALSFIDGYMDGHDLIAARDISAEYRAHARKLEILYRRLGEGYRDPRATYSPTLPLDRQDIHDMKQIRNIQTDMDNLLLEMAGGYQC